MFKLYKIGNALLIMSFIIIFFWIYGYFEQRKYEENKSFFINSCTKTFYYDNGYDLNELFTDFIKELPVAIRSKIESDFLGYGGYLSYLDDRKIKNFCGKIYDFYQEDLDNSEYNYCDDYICR